jgi:iron complex outermembrane recepter protein
MENNTMRVKPNAPFYTRPLAAPFRMSLAAALVSTLSTSIQAQEAVDEAKDPVLEEVIVTGIRASLANALDQKRDSANLIEVIQAEDIGKLPDQNLAEVLENIPGVQITRTAGVGSGVQIRGTNANRTEINGVSTSGSSTGRTGIDFEDVSASIIAGIEVIKASEAKTIEGSVGGTINLKTIRPLDLDAPLVAARVQGEHSSLSEDSNDLSPRVSGTFGNNWETSRGTFGAVGSISYTEQDVRAFRPRADRDNLVTAGASDSADFDFLPAQFFVQDYDNYKRETTVFAGSLEWAPTEELSFYFDAMYSDQDEQQESSRVQTSGISTQKDVARVSQFETVNFGSLDGENGRQNLGSIQAAVRGVIPAQNDDRFDPNLRVSTDTNSRESENNIFSLGGKWDRDNWRISAEISTSENETTTPNVLSTLNFINPNTAIGSPNENGTPIEFDLTGGALAFGIAEGEANAPTRDQLLDPANYRLRDFNQTQDEAENGEDAFRLDVSYFFDDLPVLTSIDAGYRYNETTSFQNQIRSNYGLRNMVDSPSGDLFAEVLSKGPDNFDDADGRDLFFPDFLAIDPGKANSNPDAMVRVLNEAIAEHQANTGSTLGGIDAPTSSTSGFFDIEEETNAFYVQANFEWNWLLGNIGVRYVDTDVASTGNTVTNDEVTQTTTKGSYDFWLPRINLVANAHEDVVIRAGWGEDIRRPDFDDLSTSFTFDTSPNPAVELGNPALQPEEVESFDLAVEWYFAPRAVVSVGYFHKDRSGLFTRQDTDPVEDENGFRDTSPPCENGGIFNPIADPNVFAPPGTPPGVCVPTSQVINGTGDTTQKGWELAFQYDLGHFEDKLGWASGFGLIANYTTQEFDGSEEYYSAFSRPTEVFNSLGATDTVTMEIPLIDLSEDAYNITAYYEKYGLSARMRYTWREGYRSTDFGSTSSFPWGFPVVQEDREQLNASIAYEVTDNFSVLLEAINITEEEVEQRCVNEGALLCYQGLTDRRITFGVAYRM